MTRPWARLRGIRRRCDAILRDLPLPVPFDVGRLCEAVAERRGRQIRLEYVDFGSAVLGLWVATERADLVFCERTTTLPHREHIILHELGHMLCGHDAARLPPGERLRPVLPGLDPGMVLRFLARASYSAVEEQEAEMLASLVLQRCERAPAPRGPAHTRALAGRIEAAFTWLDGDPPEEHVQPDERRG